MFQVFHLDVCNGYPRDFLVFQLFRTYDASVSSECCKSRSVVAHVVMGHLLQLLGRRACAWEVEGWSAARHSAVAVAGNIQEGICLAYHFIKPGQVTEPGICGLTRRTNELFG